MKKSFFNEKMKKVCFLTNKNGARRVLGRPTFINILLPQRLQ
jgi:hypothetical protein